MLPMIEVILSGQVPPMIEALVRGDVPPMEEAMRTAKEEAVDLEALVLAAALQAARDPKLCSSSPALHEQPPAAPGSTWPASLVPDVLSPWPWPLLGPCRAPIVSRIGLGPDRGRPNVRHSHPCLGCR